MAICFLTFHTLIFVNIMLPKTPGSIVSDLTSFFFFFLINVTIFYKTRNGENT